MAKDRFSTLATSYSQFRPNYPNELYDTILEHVSGRDVAWDCGTGNGQAAKVLASHFKRVEATDLSPQQLEKAPDIANAHFQACPAEKTPFPDHHFDLITVATAIHWFDFAAFFAEVQRVAKPGGILAFWCYSLLKVNPEIDAVIWDYYQNTLGPWWDAERNYVDEEYRTIVTPFEEIPVAQPQISLEWNLDHLTGYFTTWSGRRNYLNHHDDDPMVPLLERITPLWSTSSKTVTMNLNLRVCRIS